MFAVAELTFMVSLIPLFLSTAHVPASTAWMTSLTLYAIVATQVSYRNWMTVGVSSVNGTIWLLLALGIHG